MLPLRIERQEVDVDLADLAPPPRPRRGPRVYRLRDAAVLLATFAATLLLLDADGLHAWVTRMDVGPAQDLWSSLVEPWRRVTARARLDTPRRLALQGAERLARTFGGEGGNEELLARGWTSGADEPAPGEAPPPGEAPAQPQVLAAVAPAGGAALPAAGAGAPATTPAPTPAAGAKATAPRPSAAAPTRVLLVGDSLMVTLAPSITRAFEGDPSIQVVIADRSATGLSRPDVYDWPSVISTFVATHRPRLVICTFGGNDAQDVRDPAGKVLRFGSEPWDALYAERVRKMLTLFQGSGAEVLWLALPPMRPRAFDGRMRHLNELFAQEAGAAGAAYEPTAGLVGDKEGRFAEYLRGPRGKLVRIRTSDGIHYADDGARLVASRVKAWVGERLATQRVGAAGGGPAAPSP